MRIALVLCLAALAVAPAAAKRDDPETQLAKALAGRTAGKPTDCITQLRSNDSTTIPGVGIIYQIGSTRYLNRFEGGCPILRQDTGIITRTPTSQLCRGDIVQVRDFVVGITYGSCSFGQFTPYEKGR